MANKINSKSLGLFLVAPLGLIFAIYTGNSVSDGQLTPTFIVFGLLLLVVAVAGLGERLYLLMVICWGLNGSILILPVPLNVRQLVEIAAIFLFISDLILSNHRLAKKTSDRIDFWIWLNLGYLVTVFARNPVGFAFLDVGGRVGGKPYIDVILSLMAYFILSRYKISAEVARKLPGWLVAVTAFTTLAGGIGVYFPEVGNILGQFYSTFYPNGVGVAATQDQIFTLNTPDVERLTFVAAFGMALVLYVVSMVSPTKLLALGNLRKLGAYAAGIILILLSGFRSDLTMVMMQTMLAGALREKFLGIVKVTIISLFIIMLGILVIYTPIRLPLAVQRSLSFLPGNWEQVASSDAQGSSDWRFEMWSTVLTSDKYIHNKTLGDGFGFLRADYERGIDLMMGQQQLTETDMQQEMFMLNGDFHSGPVSTIRCVGYLGLVLFFPLLISLARYVYNITRECAGTPFQHFSLFAGIPLLLLPLTFIFIFGDFKSDLVTVIFSTGVFHMISNSVKAYKITLQKKAA
jgi:hypothetical protein